MYVTTMCWYAYTSLCILMNCENDHVVSEEGVGPWNVTCGGNKCLQEHDLVYGLDFCNVL